MSWFDCLAMILRICLLVRELIWPTSVTTSLTVPNLVWFLLSCVFHSFGIAFTTALYSKARPAWWPIRSATCSWDSRYPSGYRSSMSLTPFLARFGKWRGWPLCLILWLFHSCSSCSLTSLLWFIDVIVFSTCFQTWLAFVFIPLCSLGRGGRYTVIQCHSVFTQGCELLFGCDCPGCLVCLGKFGGPIS